MVCLILLGVFLTGKGLRSVQAGEFGDLTKGDTLRVMAASHVILAVVLIGMRKHYSSLTGRSVIITRRTVVC